MSFMERNFPSLAKGDSGEQPDDTSGKKRGKEKADGFKAVRKDYKPIRAALPQVNLLPIGAQVAAAKRKIVFGYIVGVFALIAATALIAVVQYSQAGINRQELATAQSQLADTQAQVTEYEPTAQYIDAISEREALAKQIAGVRAPYRQAFAGVGRALPVGATYTSVQMDDNPNPADDVAASQAFITACGPNTQPFSANQRPVVGCMKVEGNANGAQVALLTNGLRANPLFSNVYVTQESAGGTTPDGQVQQGVFAGSMTVQGRAG